MMHYHIVLVGVYPDAVSLCEAPVKKSFRGFVSRLCGRYPMDHIIGSVVKPSAFNA